MRKTLCTIVLALVAAACSDTPTVTPNTSTGSFPVTVPAKNGDVTIDARPSRIVSLSASSTEILFAIGAGRQVVAVDDQSNFPADAPRTKLSGFEPNVEAIAGYRPDLVVFSTDVKQLDASLKALPVAAIQHDAATSIEDTYTQIRQLGQATGRVGEAETLIARMRGDIKHIVENAPKFTARLTYYHELDSTFFSVTSSTFIGKVYALLGLRNIADAADEQKTGYPQLSPEYIIQADPDLIFLADTKCCGQTAATVARRPGWDKIEAVGNGGVVALDDDIASRWGPRIVDFLQTVSDALARLKPAA